MKISNNVVSNVLTWPGGKSLIGTYTKIYEGTRLEGTTFNRDGSRVALRLYVGLKSQTVTSPDD